MGGSDLKRSEQLASTDFVFVQKKTSINISERRPKAHSLFQTNKQQ